jgi:hypothetical protein
MNINTIYTAFDQKGFIITYDNPSEIKLIVKPKGSKINEYNLVDNIDNISNIMLMKK